MNKLTEYEQLALNKLGQSIQDGKWSNNGMVQIIELVKDFLNPITMLKYAKQKGISYNGLKKQNKAVTILGQKYIIDNE
jgi:hypothetical protein